MQRLNGFPTFVIEAREKTGALPGRHQEGWALEKGEYR
ncbi:hypothetical protein RGUI_3175 [Rhodovulum sp. P5]|nr:hypothetical protein RGUI_3175 [Rhodovulum sp. P5]